MTLEIVSNADIDTLLASCDVMTESLGFSFADARAATHFIESEGRRIFVSPSTASRRAAGASPVSSRVNARGQFLRRRIPAGPGAIRCVGVAPELRGRGILRRLMTHTLGRAS